MSNIFYILYFGFCFGLNSALYWDLGIAITPQSFNSDANIELSTFHRIEGLKKYYVDNFEGAIFHFEQLNGNDQQNIFYEYIDSYYAVGKYRNALSVLELYNINELSDNLLYLKSKILMKTGNYEESILLLEKLTLNFPDSDYLTIIKFELERLNLLK